MYTILTGKAWIPAFAGMTRSGNRQSINRIGISEACARAAGHLRIERCSPLGFFPSNPHSKGLSLSWDSLLLNE